MDRAATQYNHNTQTAANHTYTVQCGRCRAVIEYDDHTDWHTVSLLVNEHLGTCPAKLDFHGPAPSPPSETYDTQNAPSHNFLENMGADDSKHDNQFITELSQAEEKRASAEMGARERRVHLQCMPYICQVPRMREGDQLGQALQILSWILDQTQREMSRNPRD
ncbi:hypothetical protein EV702DRAFT_157787 [Suillus placidus]|uniref:Uncharacterized protein n=1 Tax=Suillus placidus TaxID=48579 RepID=A0A9P7D497_9AGAM|nr:hypothetical protein EV702DRAFT_157787 [Suillus placidus]